MHHHSTSRQMRRDTFTQVPKLKSFVLRICNIGIALCKLLFADFGPQCHSLCSGWGVSILTYICLDGSKSVIEHT